MVFNRVTPKRALIRQMSKIENPAKMEAHIADLKSQLAQITAELERLNNEELFCTEELQEVTQKLAERTELNNKRVAEMTQKLEKVITDVLQFAYMINII